MKRILFILLVAMYSIAVYAQQTAKDYIGTWKYEKEDTVFTIRLIKGEAFYKGKPKAEIDEELIFGGYSLSVKNKMVENYITDINTKWVYENINGGEQHIYIYGACNTRYKGKKGIGFKFYDQRMKHFNGEGIWGGTLEPIGPNKLHWTLNEKEGIWWETEGLEDWVEVKPIGFSVPTDVIMTKVDE